MSSKLTKEQADCLMDNIANLPKYAVPGDAPVIPDIAVNLVEVLKLITRHTEKGFPEYLLDRGAREYSIAIKLDGDIYISVSDPDWRNSQFGFSLEEFKQFAEGVAKINQWLEEQENDSKI